MFRRGQLCPGPGECGDVLMRDPFANAESEPCAECPLALLDDYLASPAGRLIASTINLDFALQAGVTVSLKEIAYPEFLLLRFLVEERHRFHNEEAKKQSEHHGR
jgi:hypothetical protein